MKRIPFLAFGLLFLAACSALGPVKSAEFDSLVSAALPKDSGKVLLARTGVMHVGDKTDRSFGEAPALMELGIVAVAENGFYFLQWDKSSKAYKIEYWINYKDITSVTDKGAWNYAFYIVEKDLDSNGFDIRVFNGQTLTREGTEEAYKLVAARVKPQA